MRVEIRREAGHEDALLGMALSYKDRALDLDDWWDQQFPKALARAPKLCRLGAGHNKFMRQIQLWVDIEAPRCFWSEFDTYKVGTVAQSESTMHTLSKRAPTYEDFEKGTPWETMGTFITQWPEIKHDVTKLKLALPEGFLQRRIVTMNYANVQAIVEQRLEHRLTFWKTLIDAMRAQLQNPDYIDWETKK